MTERLYQETYRPQFHFTAKENWLNDPNGLVYYKGEYHLFFQHNPKGLEWGPNTWGHAVSDDLIHWKQIEHAIEPDEMGWIWSGSAVVDWENTGGLRTGDENTLIAFYTTGDNIAKPGKPCVQCIAYSNDLGRTWTRYEGNPVLEHIVGHNRDPKVIWHVPTSRWVMSLFLDGNDYALFSSSNLKEWTHLCDINLPGTGECPDIFELPVDGDDSNTRWVFWGGNGNYCIGTFDGRNFRAESNVLRCDWGANFYAAQTWSDIPPSDGRRIQIAWMSGGKYPDMPFNQQMSIPCELTLRTTPEGIRMYRQPVKEIESLHKNESVWKNQALSPGENLLSDISGDLLDIRAEIKLVSAVEVGFIIRGKKVKYNIPEKQLFFLERHAHLEPLRNTIQLQILVDRASIEVFGNAGRISMSSCFLPDPGNTDLNIYSLGGEAEIVSMNVYEMRSIWL